MASLDSIAELRRLVNEPDQDTYTDLALSDRIDRASSLRGLAAEIWDEKAATYAELADVQEGNSRRSLSQLYKQALEMSARFAAPDPALSSTRRSRTRKIERQ